MSEALKPDPRPADYQTPKLAFVLTRQLSGGWYVAGRTVKEVLRCLKGELDTVVQSDLPEAGGDVDEIDPFQIELRMMSDEEIENLPESGGW